MEELLKHSYKEIEFSIIGSDIDEYVIYVKNDQDILFKIMINPLNHYSEPPFYVNDNIYIWIGELIDAEILHELPKLKYIPTSNSNLVIIPEHECLKLPLPLCINGSYSYGSVYISKFITNTDIFKKNTLTKCAKVKIIY